MIRILCMGGLILTACTTPPLPISNPCDIDYVGNKSCPDVGVDEDMGPPVEGAFWIPRQGTSWQWQLTGDIDISVDVDMYDIDLFDASQGVINALHTDGRMVICYFSAGSYEEWRPDIINLPEAALGNALDDWPGERWLDIRHASVRSLMTERIALANSKSCDGVEPDNVAGYGNDTGFELSADDQLDFNRFLARSAHEYGMSIGLKNDLDQVPALVDDFDWALNEQCFEYNECGKLKPFIDAGKAVFSVEYGDEELAEQVCAQANALHFDTLIKPADQSVTAWRHACR